MIYADAAGPAIRWRVVTPDDVAVLDPMPRALFVNGSGHLALEDRTGSIASWLVTSGQFLPLSPLRVRATGTTVTGILALW
jgi:hypothetical protein